MRLTKSFTTVWQRPRSTPHAFPACYAGSVSFDDLPMAARGIRRFRCERCDVR